MWNEPAPVLDGRFVRLEPLSNNHVSGLELAARDRSTFGFTAVPSSREAHEAYVEQMVALGKSGQALAFAQVDLASGNVVGTTRFMTPRFDGDRLYAIEIGGTWLAQSRQGSGINREAKLLLATYAFEHLGVVRVDCKTDARNERARRSIEGWGATFEGVLRQWQPSLVAGEEGMFRDTAMYAVTVAQWPTVRQELERSLYS